MKYFQSKPLLFAIAAAVCGLPTPLLSQAADEPALTSQNSADTLPAAKSGECYAKVSVPAVYKIEEFDVVTKAGSEQIKVTPAAFKTVDTSIMVKEASTRLIPVPAELETITEKVLTSDVEHVWMRINAGSELPASKGLLSDLAESGIDLENVAVGSC
ncbi:MAG: hypothetical protein KTR33_16915, partial [Gammaproteobacteria bacterium]|nr:hypothetical protein [Gammaproteobacteria bacterium]